MDDQMFTPEGLQMSAEMLPLHTQHLLLSQTLTMLQSALTNHLLHNQQVLSNLVDHIPEQ